MERSQKVHSSKLAQHFLCKVNVLSSCPGRCGAGLAEAGVGALQLGVVVQPVGLQPDAEGLQGDQKIHRFSLEAVFAALQVGVGRSGA